MRVLMTADTVGGVWSYAMELCRALAPAGVQVHLATMGEQPTAAQRAQAASLRNVRLYTSDFRLEWMDDPWDDLAAAGEWLRALERETQPEVVHLNSFAHGALRWRVPALVVGHSCVLSWWRAVRGEEAPPSWNRYREAVSAGLRGAAAVVAPTRTMLDALSEHYGPLAFTAVVPNGIEPRPPAGGPSGDGIVLAAGRLWDESKNVATLAAAAAHIEWPVFVAGPEHSPRHAARPLSSVIRLGPLPPDTLRAWYARASILVHPAVYEPFGLVPLEAALERCALVLGDIPSLREVWGDAACYVPPRDPGAIAAAVNRLAADPGERGRLADAAHRRAQRYSAYRMARAYHDIYRRLRSGAGRGQGGMATCAS